MNETCAGCDGIEGVDSQAGARHGAPEPKAIYRHRDHGTRIQIIGQVMGSMVQVKVLDGILADEFHNVYPQHFGTFWLPVEQSPVEEVASA